MIANSSRSHGAILKHCFPTCRGMYLIQQELDIWPWKEELTAAADSRESTQMGDNFNNFVRKESILDRVLKSLRVRFNFQQLSNINYDFLSFHMI